MRIRIFFLAALALFSVNALADLTATFTDVGNLSNDEPSKTAAVDVLAGDVVVMVAVTNKKLSATGLSFSSTAGTMDNTSATAIAGNDRTNTYLGQIEIAASGNYDFTATADAAITANVALYVVRADSGEVVTLATAANQYRIATTGDSTSITDSLSWASDPNYGQVAVVGGASSTKGDISTSSLVLDINVPADGVKKRLVGTKQPLTAGTTSYDVTWNITAAGDSENGTSISRAFAEKVGDAPKTYSVGGSVSGLSATLVLSNDGVDLTVSSGDSSYAFTVDEGADYDITISQQPAGQECVVANGSGSNVQADVTNADVTCSDVPTYSIGGTISGLDGSVTLQNNGGDDLVLTTGATAFTFSAELREGEGYLVEVSVQPDTQNCTVANGNGTVATSDIDNIEVSCVTVDKYSVGGAVSGLSGSVTLQNNGGDDLTLTEDGSFVFAVKVAVGEDYNVTVSSQPATQDCTVSSGSGTIAADVSDVAVTCVDVPVYDLGGSLSGLDSGSVTLVNNGFDQLVLSANGAFTFPTGVKAGDRYSIAVASQPSLQRCRVTSGATGIMTDAGIDDVVVTCEIAIDDGYEAVPTLSQWGLLLLTLMVGLVAVANRRLF